MSKTEELLRQWTLQVAGPATPMVSWIALGYPTTPEGGSGRTPMDDHLANRGLDPERQIGQGRQQMVAAITDQQLFFGSVGGIFTVRPKELLGAASLPGCQVEWWDQAQVGPDQRHLRFLFDDGWVRTSARIDKRSNADAFLAALGSRAVHVER